MKHRRILSALLSLAILTQVLLPSAWADDSSLPFLDVSPENWFYSNVCYVYENKLMNGTGPETFSPDEDLTRGMVVTVLHRMEGCPEAEACTFTDVPAEAYYADAVAWAQSKGIVSGYDSLHFGPEDCVTREQMVTILYRYTAAKGGSPDQRSPLSQFDDTAKISTYALSAVRWAVSVGLVSGRSPTAIVPNGLTTRAEFATLICRMNEKVLSDPAVMTPQCANIPIIMFHSISEVDSGSFTSTQAHFRSLMQALYDAGYHTVSYRQLIDYVDFGTPLPENPFVLTLDDGYRNNLTYVVPILEEFDYCCEIAVIGSFIGQDSFCDVPIIPHFTLEEVLECPDGIVNIESHTMRMHMSPDFPPDCGGRQTVLQLPDETDEEYMAALLQDFAESKETIAATLASPVCLTYPRGQFSLASEAAAKETGYRVTATTRYGGNIITVGNPESLYLLRRMNVSYTITPETLLESIEYIMISAAR